MSKGVGNTFEDIFCFRSDDGREMEGGKDHLIVLRLFCIEKRNNNDNNGENGVGVTRSDMIFKGKKCIKMTGKMG